MVLHPQNSGWIGSTEDPCKSHPAQHSGEARRSAFVSALSRLTIGRSARILRGFFNHCVLRTAGVMRYFGRGVSDDSTDGCEASLNGLESPRAGSAAVRLDTRCSRGAAFVQPRGAPHGAAPAVPAPSRRGTSGPGPHSRRRGRPLHRGPRPSRQRAALSRHGPIRRTARREARAAPGPAGRSANRRRSSPPTSPALRPLGPPSLLIGCGRAHYAEWSGADWVSALPVGRPRSPPPPLPLPAPPAAAAGRAALGGQRPGAEGRAAAAGPGLGGAHAAPGGGGVPALSRAGR